MTINQIVDEMEKEFDEIFMVQAGDLKAVSPFATLEEIKSFIHSYTRKLIESVAEEIIPPNFEYCDSCVSLGVENFGGWCSICKDQLNANRRYNQQRLKVKDIITNLK